MRVFHRQRPAGKHREEQRGRLDKEWVGGDQFLVRQIQKKAVDIRCLLDHFCDSMPFHHLRSDEILTTYLKVGRDQFRVQQIQKEAVDIRCL